MLYTGKDFVIIDFEGQPAGRSPNGAASTCLCDVAGMLRSFHYAAFTALLAQGVVRDREPALIEPWALAWYGWVSGTFLRSYLDATTGMPFLATADNQRLILDSHIIRRALFELGTSWRTAPKRLPSPSPRSSNWRGCSLPNPPLILP